MTFVITRLNGLGLYQDLGRPGYANLGVSPSGAASRSGLTAANTAVGNLPGAPAIELTGQMIFHSRVDGIISTTGARAHVEGASERSTHIPRGQVWEISKGTEVTITTTGLRSYIAVRGGFNVPRTLGSAAHDTLSGLGPAPLDVGEELTIGEHLGPLRTFDPAGQMLVAPGGPGPLLLASVYPGPRGDWVEDLEELFAHEYRVSEDSDRVGVRLTGTPLRRHRSEELPSEGIVRGAIQLPPEGTPLVFGPDHPTTGGYPVIGVLAPLAADALAHAAPGQAVRFRRAMPRRG